MPLLVVVLAMGCGHASHVVPGPITLKALDSRDDTVVLEALVRIGGAYDPDHGPKYPELARKIEGLYRDQRRSFLVRTYALLGSVGNSDEFLGLLTKPGVASEFRTVAALVFSLRRSELGIKVPTVRSILVDDHIDVAVRYAVVMGLRSDSSSDPDGDELRTMLVDLGCDRHLPVVLRSAILTQLPDGLLRDAKTVQKLLELFRENDLEISLATAAAMKGAGDSKGENPAIADALTAIALDDSSPDDLFATAIQGIADRPLERLVHKTVEKYLSNATPPPVHRVCEKRLTEWGAWDDRLAEPAFLALLTGDDVDDQVRLLNIGGASSRALGMVLQVHEDRIHAAIRDSSRASAHKALFRLFSSWLGSKDLRPAIERFTHDIRAGVGTFDAGRRGPTVDADTLLDILDVHSAPEDAQGLAVELLTQLAAPELVVMVQSPDVAADLRGRIIRSLASMAPAALSGQLLASIAASDQPDLVRVMAILALATKNITPPGDPRLLTRLLSDSKNSEAVQIALIDAASALHHVDHDYLSSLIRFVNPLDCNVSPRRRLTSASLSALAKAGSEAVVVLPKLGTLLTRKDSCRYDIAETITKVAAGAVDDDTIAALPMLRAILESAPDSALSPGQRKSIQDAVHRLEIVDRARWLPRYRDFVASHWVFTGVALYVLVLVVVSIVLLLFAPLLLLRASMAIDRLGKLQLPKAIGSVETVLGLLTVLTWFRNADRVIDAWVASQRAGLAAGFAQLEPVRLRTPHIFAPAEVNGVNVPVLDRAALAGHVPGERSVFVIEGEGGAGKSSLAFEIARWMLANDRAERFFAWTALPVLIDYDVSAPATPPAAPGGGGTGGAGSGGGGGGSLLKEVRIALSRFTGWLPPDSFIERMLARRRILVIVDRLSELGSESQRTLGEGLRIGDARAVIVTTRVAANLTHLRAVTIRPLNLRGSTLLLFIEKYLKGRSDGGKLPEKDLYRICDELSALTKLKTSGPQQSRQDKSQLRSSQGSPEHHRGITALLARLYVDDELNRRRSDNQTAGSAPTRIPELMSNYVDQVYGKGAYAYSRTEAHDLLRIVARRCVGPEHALRPAAISDVIAALEDEGKKKAEDEGKKKLDFLNDALGLVQLTGTGRDQVRFALDPLAEYLSARKVIAVAQGQPAAWNEVLKDLAATLQRNAAARSYALAMMDCIEADPESAPVGVLAKLRALADGALPPDALQDLAAGALHDEESMTG